MLAVKLKSIKLNDSNDFIGISKDYVHSKGILLRKADKPTNFDHVQHAPYTLLPSPFCRNCFDEALQVQLDINLLMFKIANDYSFLKECLHDVIQVDEFTRNIWNIYETVFKIGYKQPLSLAIIRTDYMMHSDDNGGTKQPKFGIKQVEINTISASFASHSQKLNDYHRFILNEVGHGELSKNLPKNESLNCVAQALVKAWELYASDTAVILILVQDTDRNVYDQRFVEFEVKNINPKIKIIRQSLETVSKTARLDQKSNLFVSEKEIAIVYQRSCYMPNDFEFNGSWNCRMLIEKSRAILCPSTGFQLAGTKKVQQVLSKPGILERFISDQSVISRIRRTFADQFSFDLGAEGDRAIDLALSKPDNFVIKPQREGGGNNTYGSDIIPLLSRIRSTDERLSYILMQRINPPIVDNIPVVANQPVPRECVEMISELGVYSYIIGSGDKVVANRQQGFLLRTKRLGVNEGGVATGYSALDSPLLMDF